VAVILIFEQGDDHEVGSDSMIIFIRS